MLKKSLFLVLLISLNGCSRFTQITNNSDHYVNTSLSEKQQEIIAKDLTNQIMASYPEKATKFKVSQIQTFGSKIADNLRKNGYSVVNTIFTPTSQTVEKEQVNEKMNPDDDYNPLMIKYNVDQIEDKNYYATVTVATDLRITRQYKKNGKDKLTIFDLLSRGMNDE